MWEVVWVTFSVCVAITLEYVKETAWPSVCVPVEISPVRIHKAACVRGGTSDILCDRGCFGVTLLMLYIVKQHEMASGVTG